MCPSVPSPVFDLEIGREGIIDKVGGGGGGAGRLKAELHLSPFGSLEGIHQAGYFMPAWGRRNSGESKTVWPEERATSLSLRWISQNIPHTPMEEGWQMDELTSRKPAVRSIMVRGEGTLCRACRVNFPGPGTQ